ncbi:MAG: hypothetical protein ACI9VM_000220 [Candidatus Azotimanducaceae bacterium]|jgi:hypothetical protein
MNEKLYTILKKILLAVVTLCLVLCIGLYIYTLFNTDPWSTGSICYQENVNCATTDSYVFSLITILLYSGLSMIGAYFVLKLIGKSIK